MKTVCKNTVKFREKLDKLPKMYLVGCWAHYGTMDFPFSGKFVKDKWTNTLVPLVWNYYDGNGTCDVWELIPITNTTTGSIICWTEIRSLPNKIAKALNIDDAFRHGVLVFDPETKDRSGVKTYIQEELDELKKEEKEFNERWAAFMKEHPVCETIIKEEEK